MMKDLLRRTEQIAYISSQKSLARTQWLIIALVLAGFGLLYAFAGGRIRVGLCDFEVFYRAGERFLAGESVYNPADGHLSFKYFPVNALFFALWAVIPLTIAKVCWYFLIIITGWLFINICFRQASEENGTLKSIHPFIYVITLLIVGTYWYHEADFGQTNIMMFLALMFSARSMLHDQTVKTALWWNVAFIIKPYALLFLPYIFWKQKWQAFGLSLALGIVAFFLPIAGYGVTGFFEVLKGIQSTAGASSATLVTDYWNASLFALFAKFGVSSYQQVTYCALLSGLVLGGIFAVQSFGKIKRDRFSAELAVLFLLVPLVSPQGWRYIFWVGGVGVVWLIVRWHHLNLIHKVVALFIFFNIGGIQFELMGRKGYEWYLNSPLIPLAMVIFVVFLLYLTPKLTLKAPNE